MKMEEVVNYRKKQSKKRTKALRETKVKKMKSDPTSKLMKLTAKQRGYVEDVALHGMTKDEAVKGNYSVTDESARGTVKSLDKNEKVQDAIAAIYEAHGVTRPKIAQAIARGLDAKKQVVNQKEGTAYEVGLHDHDTQLKAAKLASDIFGDKGQEVGGQHLHLHIDAREANQMEEAVMVVLEEKFGKKDIIEGDVIDN